MTNNHVEFWKIIYRNWTWTQLVELRAACEAWMAADHSRR